jgi:hypothetical protein
MRTSKHSPHKHGPKDYRWLADKVREAAHTVSTEGERAELSRAKLWDFLAEHSPAASSELNE